MTCKICPICQSNLIGEKVNSFENSKPCKRINYQCYNPLKENPLHLYIAVTSIHDEDKIIFEKFSLNLGIRYVIVGIDYNNNETLIWKKHVKEDDPIKLSFIIKPDYPKLHLLKNKIKLSITFT